MNDNAAPADGEAASEEKKEEAKMKKKWLKAMGAAFVLTLALAGCGNDAEPQESTAAAEESAAETETEEE